MKNWKCIIGATLLTPICVGFGLGFVAGFAWLIIQLPTILPFIFACFILLGASSAIWWAIFDHCKKRRERKEVKTMK